MSGNRVQVQQAGFTLVELVVMAVITTLFLAVIPSALRAREAANRTQCQSGLRQIGLALHNDHNIQARRQIRSNQSDYAAKDIRPIRSSLD